MGHPCKPRESRRGCLVNIRRVHPQVYHSCFWIPEFSLQYLDFHITACFDCLDIPGPRDLDSLIFCLLLYWSVFPLMEMRMFHEAPYKLCLSHLVTNCLLAALNFSLSFRRASMHLCGNHLTPDLWSFCLFRNCFPHMFQMTVSGHWSRPLSV